MRVGLIAPPWIPIPPPAYGGIEAVLDALARGLVDAGHEVLLVTTGDSTCPVERRWVYEEARPEEIGSFLVEQHHVQHAFEALTGVDIVHDHTVAGPILADRFPLPPLLTTNHGPFTAETGSLYRLIAGRVPIVAISHHQASTAGAIPVARVIHHGLDQARYPVGDGSGGYLLFLGRMSPSKGVRQAIEIARLAGMPLVIAAKMRAEPEREYFEADIAPLLGPDVSYAGEVGGAAKLELIGGAAGMLNPVSWDEPFGFCMIEAMACGTPIIATPRGAVPEIVDDGVTGFLCSTEQDMAAAVAQLHSIDRGACRAAVETRFSARRMVADHVDLYEEILAGASDRRRPVDVDLRPRSPQGRPASPRPHRLGEPPVPASR